MKTRRQPKLDKEQIIFSMAASALVWGFFISGFYLEDDRLIAGGLVTLFVSFVLRGIRLHQRGVAEREARRKAALAALPMVETAPLAPRPFAQPHMYYSARRGWVVSDPAHSTSQRTVEPHRTVQ